jgi:hypothetical protein
MSLILTATQQATYTVAFVDGKGNPAPVQGVPVWASSMPTVLAVTPAPDGMSCLAKAVGPLGTAQLSVTADAELDEDVTEIVGLDTIQVVAGQAVSASMTPGTPEEQA